MKKAPSIAIAVAAALLAACGSETPAGSMDAAFVSEANAVCADALTRRPGVPPPLPVENFDPQHPKADQLPLIGAHFSKYNDGERVHRELAALGQPRTGVEDWQKILGLTQQSGKNASSQIDAAKAGDVTNFVRLVNEGSELTRQLGRIALPAGFTQSAPCTKYYGG